MMKAREILAALVVGAVTMSGHAFAEPPAKTEPAPHKDGHKDDHKKDTKEHKELKDKKKDEGKAGAAIGALAPEFKLTDTAGKDVSLADFKGKIVVIEWFNPDCPFIVKHHSKLTTFNDLHKKYSDKGVVFLGINSSAAGKEGAGKERNAKAVTEFKIPYPVLLDESGKIGKAYGAQTTPHCFVINKDGVLAYKGAIDDDRSADKAGKTNYVAKALDEILAGQSVSTSETKPYGCGVKYGS